MVKRRVLMSNAISNVLAALTDLRNEAR